MGDNKNPEAHERGQPHWGPSTIRLVIESNALMTDGLKPCHTSLRQQYQNENSPAITAREVMMHAGLTCGGPGDPEELP